MKLEFKKSISNKILMTLSILFVFSFLLGYFLPVGIDKVTNLDYPKYFFSAYTVLTEFGFLLFSFIISYFINKEYSNKSLLFYKLIKENIYSFFYKKASILFLESLAIIVVGITIISMVFSDFSHYFFLIIMFLLVVLQYILVVGTISIVSPNVLISIGLSIVYWIASIILVAINKEMFGFLAPFEASNSMYVSVEKVLNGEIPTINLHDVLTIALFFTFVFIVNFIVLGLFKKRWLKLGL
ncbi:peptide ABC transporter permease [Staphylococcus pseudintermedius]|nr:peptide ABC transporter permease [Staphylococcus pseudintermedius]EJD5707367.1 peptide ABC transporter permease [Staphylococcus pseudintermedius]EJD5727660.1 peptide ABC transporter permease [Staphylococcus pseudintermedius]ELJ5456373.1 peptide ABC transporter permease [Staphylococcus pseudintermedius]MDF0016992.1 peptide ABC transporter permease [Staphylococcus pseudintermedius]